VREQSEPEHFARAACLVIAALHRRASERAAAEHEAPLPDPDQPALLDLGDLP
jgi:hypothetical protein